MLSKINAVQLKQSFGSNNKEDKKDPLMQPPLRLCAYTNEVGAALSPIPRIGSTLFKLSWIPALMYFGADIYNKYAKGENNNYEKPSKNNALQAAVFQGLASVILPTAAVIAGQEVADKIYGYASKDKLSVNQKEDILRELKRDLNQDKLRNYRNSIYEIIEGNRDKSLEEIKQLDSVKTIKNTLGESIYHDLIVESKTYKHHKQTRGFVQSCLDIIFQPHFKCKNLSALNDDSFTNNVKPYLQSKIDNMVNIRIELQNTLNRDGLLNDNSQQLDRSLLRKFRSILNKNLLNNEIKDKSCFAVSETIISKIQKHAIKLSTVKILGGFIALALLAKPIDHLVENYVVNKISKNKSDNK